MVQEALVNALKHSNTHAIQLQIAESTTDIQVTITDTGRGFNVEKTQQSGKAFGIARLAERAKAIKGNASIQSNNLGTVVSTVIPQNSRL